MYADEVQLDPAVKNMAEKLSRASPEAMSQLKAVLWQGTETWGSLLKQRAAISGTLVQSDFTRNFIAEAKKKDI